MALAFIKELAERRRFLPHNLAATGEKHILNAVHSCSGKCPMSRHFMRRGKLLKAPGSMGTYHGKPVF